MRLSLASADILRDFESKTLQEEWNRFGRSVMQQRSQRMKETQAAIQVHQFQIQEARKVRHQRMQTIDAHLQSMEDSFEQGAQSLDDTSTKLIERYGAWTTKEVDDPSKESKPLPCLGPRAHWIDCQKKYGAVDSRPCNFYVEALEECVHQAVTGSPGEVDK